MEKFLGLAEINLIGTDTFKFNDKFEFRYHFASARVIEHGGKKMLETDRFYVWAEAIDTAYQFAVKHVYRALNEKYQDCVDPGEGGGLYDAEIDEQHREVLIDNQKDWDQIVLGINGDFEDRNDFYLGDY